MFSGNLKMSDPLGVGTSPVWSTLVLIGVGSILAAIVGGGVKLAVVQIREFASVRRQIGLAIFGLALIGLGLAGGGNWPGMQARLGNQQDPSLSKPPAGESLPGNRTAAPSAARHARPRNEFDDCGGESWCPKMIALPGGSFLMGTPRSEADREFDEGPQRRVNVEAFAVGKFEITFAQWDACLVAQACDGYRPGDGGFGRGDRPVINVSWHRAVAYVNWLSSRTGRNYRLLTEAEWEYAARAGTTSAWPWGDESNGSCRFANIADLALVREDQSYPGSRCDDRVGARTANVGSYAPSPFGLYDMIGNVWEWTQDCYVNTYTNLPTNGLAATTGDCNNRVHRGGAWDSASVKARSGYRNWWDPSARNNNLGFRVARSL